MTGDMQRRRGPRRGGRQEPREGPRDTIHGITNQATHVLGSIWWSSSQHLQLVICFLHAAHRGLEYGQGERWPLHMHPPNVRC